jgi:DNA-binding XRE family transcriptional regulator
MKTSYVYKFKNKITNEFYIGSRISKNSDTEEGFDIYSSSNELVSEMILNNKNLWEKEILFFGESKDVLFKEYELIKTYKNNELCLNMISFNDYKKQYAKKLENFNFDELFSQLGFRLKIARIKRKISQIEASNSLEISRTTLNRIENGSYHVEFGTYIKYLYYLGFGEEFSIIATKDLLGDKIINYDLMKSKK